MAKFNEVLKTMVEQSGVSVSDETIKKILDNPALASIEVDDAVSNRLTANRFTLDAAKANPDLKKHFTALALNGVDAEVSKTILELELGDEVKNEIESQDTTFKKVSALAKKVKELEAKKAGTSKVDKTKLEQEIEKLNNDIKTVKDSYTAEKTKLLGDFENERINFEVDTFLNSFNFALPKETPAETVRDFGRSLINKAFTDKGVKLNKKDGAIVLQTQGPLTSSDADRLMEQLVQRIQVYGDGVYN